MDLQELPHQQQQVNLLRKMSFCLHITERVPSSVMTAEQVEICQS